MVKNGAILRALTLKELRAEAASRGTGVFLLLSVAVLAVAALATVLINADKDGSWMSLALPRILAVAEVCLVIGVVSVRTAGTIVLERSQSTWDVLILSRISPLAILCAKLAAAVASGSLLIVAAIPLYVLSRLYGPFDTMAGLRVVAVLIATVILAAAAGLLVSSFSAVPTGGRLTGLIVALLFGPGLSALTVHANGTLPFAPLSANGAALGVVSPVAAVVAALARDGGPLYYPANLSVGVQLWAAYAATSLVLSGLLLAMAQRSISRSRGHAAEFVPA